MSARSVTDLRRLMRESAAANRPPEEWMLVAFPDAEAVVELLPLLQLADDGSPAQDLLARHIRYRLGTHIAAALQMLDALERQYGLTGPISDDRLSNREAQAAIERLSKLVRA